MLVNVLVNVFLSLFLILIGNLYHILNIYIYISIYKLYCNILYYIILYYNMHICILPNMEKWQLIIYYSEFRTQAVIS